MKLVNVIRIHLLISSMILSCVLKPENKIEKSEPPMNLSFTVGYC